MRRRLFVLQPESGWWAARTVAELESTGVRQISLATSLYRAAMTGLIAAAREVKEQGTFTYLDQTIATPDFNKFMQG